MATYLKLFTDYAETFDDMSDTEAGRLIKAILHYGASGEVRTLSGGERLVFGIIKRQIDRDNESADSHREAGKTGGRPKTKQNQTKPSETKQNQTEPNFSEKEKEEEKDEDKEKDNDDDLQRAGARESSLSADDAHRGIMLNQEIESAARDIGLQTSVAGMQTAHNLGAQYGYDNLIAAIKASVDCPKWSYVEGVLRNQGKPRPFTRRPGQSIAEAKGERLMQDLMEGKFDE